MTDPVLRVLVARLALSEQGYAKSLLLSGAAHATTFLAILILTLLSPPRKLINVIDGFAVPLPRGGGRPRPVEPAVAPVEKPPEAASEVPKEAPGPPAPVKLIKPETVAPKKGLAPVDLRQSVKEVKKPESREIATSKVVSAAPPKGTPAPAPGAASAALGLDFTAQTPGVMDGSTGPTGALGFYLAAVKNKIWATWARQLRSGFSGNVTVAFTIHRDGSVDQVEVIETSGAPTVDRLAERAVLSTQLGPIPTTYEKETIVLHATFKPVP